MKRITVGVAGHVDHGKTALVQALTGTDTDRLKEEKERGMSIALGFAHLDFPEGEVDLIDVPGHERFIKTMISGATGIEAVVLVVEANEMVKPQTVEHLELTELLGVKKGIVAITKSDLIPPEDADLRAIVAQELGDFLRGTFLEDAPVIFTSARTGEGVDALRCALRGLLLDAATVVDQPFFYLPIDRVFSLSGHGTIVTGTLRRGPLRVGQNVEIVGQTGRRNARRAEVRGLQVHNRAVEQVSPGGRVAVNLRGMKRDDLQRGDALASTGFLRSSRRLDAELQMIRSAAKPVTKGQLARIYFGTTEGIVRVYPLDRSEIAPGDAAPVQFRFRAPITAPFRERFVLRTYSSGETVGGGIVADVDPGKHVEPDPEIARRVLMLAHGSIAEMLAAKIEEAGYSGCEIEALARALSLSPDRVKREALSLPVVVCGSTHVIEKSFFDAAAQQAITYIDSFHAENPSRAGIPKIALRALLPSALPLIAYNRLLETLRRAGMIETEETAVRHAGFVPALALGPEDREIAREIEQAFRAGGLTPPDAGDVLCGDGRRAELHRYLVKSGVLVAATDRVLGRTVTFHRDAIEGAVRQLLPHLAEKGITTSEANQILGITRKFGIPLLENLDSRGITRRVGDRRVARPGKSHGSSVLSDAADQQSSLTSLPPLSQAKEGESADETLVSID